MLDFLCVSVVYDKNGNASICPGFMSIRSKDLMVKGGKFYAIWDESVGLWSTDPFRAQELIDQELYDYKRSDPKLVDATVNYLKFTSNRYIAKWHTFLEQDMRDTFVQLDTELHFAGKKLTREDYASKQLPYPLQEGSHDSWDELMGTLYSPEELHKIEWCVGAIVSGDSKEIQKFLVLYGAGGTGKSTVIGIIASMFKGYCKSFESKILGSTNSQFSLEPLAENPLIAYDPDGKLDRIEDNTRLNSIVAHDVVVVNSKNTKMYPMRFNCFLIIASNTPVRITDAKSGLIRRLIDASPTGKTVDYKRYLELTEKMKFEYSGIAWHCLQVYRENPRYYDKYIPERMLGESNDFYNFIIEHYEHYKNQNWTTLNEAWTAYKEYTTEARVPFPLTQIRFKAELKNYFNEFKERARIDGRQVYNLYSDFKADIFTSFNSSKPSEQETSSTITLKKQESKFDILCADCPAQYANDDGIPTKGWDYVRTVLRQIDTCKIHYVRPPENHIVIDFDLKDDNGNKSLERNIEAASKWPKTYAEVSKSGAGLHLHYIYYGDVNRLSSYYDENIEVKVFTGKSSLRRKLTLCNDYDITTIDSGLPLLEERKKVVDEYVIKSEKKLRERIIEHLSKRVKNVKSTAQNVSMIFDILENVYNNGLNYDVRDMRPAITAFANSSTNSADRCLKLVKEMKFASTEPSAYIVPSQDAPIAFFDIEIYPNFFGVCWKTIDGPMIKWKNPDSVDMETLCSYRLVGYNNLNYDNYIIYARRMGYTVPQLYSLNKKIIDKSSNVGLYEAKNLSYTDVYDFVSKKQSLKKYEIEYGCHHQEMGLDWDKEVPEELWDSVLEYCANDVLATQLVWEKRQGDFEAREILADLTGLTVNDTTNTHTKRLIFSNNRTPQSEFNYVHLAGSEGCEVEHISEVVSPKTGKKYSVNPEWTCRDLSTGQMMFPGYLFEYKTVGSKKVPVSTYRGIEVGEGGYVCADHGIWFLVKTLDVSGMHPASIRAMELFGTKYTKIFGDLVDARLAIKRGLRTGNFDDAKKLFDGRLAKYLDDPSKAKMLVNALKIAVNSVYGLTAAKFDNPFRDPRNVDNIVAKRGALFMVNLMKEVEEKDAHVVHIKTDSIKIDNITPEIEDFIHAYGALYGYSFEIEHSFDRICLVNNAVYIGKCAEDDPDIPGMWTATGKQFAVPYVFKTLFSHEPIEFEDKFEVINVTSALYLDMNEGLPDVSEYEKEEEKILKKFPNDITRLMDIRNRIEQGHHYVFVGKVGAFCPMKPGAGGGVLCRINNAGGFDSAVGTKGYRWLEAEVVKRLGKEDDIDISYYRNLIDGAKAAIEEFGDFEAFVE